MFAEGQSHAKLIVEDSFHNKAKIFRIDLESIEKAWIEIDCVYECEQGILNANLSIDVSVELQIYFVFLIFLTDFNLLCQRPMQ